MRFKGRMDQMPGEEKQRLVVGYFRQLVDLKLSAADPLYRLFGGDVFHDSEILLETIDLSKKTVAMSLRNIYAIDRIGNSSRGKDGMKAQIHKADFWTRATFSGVSFLEIAWPPGEDPAVYHEAELGREGDDLLLEIVMCSGFEQGMLRISFQSAEVADIGPRLTKYLHPPERVAQYLSSIEHDAAFYVAHPEKLWECDWPE